MTIDNRRRMEALLQHADDRRLIDVQSDGRPDDPPVAYIVEYTNAWGGTCWGVTFCTESLERQTRYLEVTHFVRAPRLLWSAEHGRLA